MRNYLLLCLNLPFLPQYLLLGTNLFFTWGVPIVVAVDIVLMVIVEMSAICVCRDDICWSRLEICVAIIWFVDDSM